MMDENTTILSNQKKTRLKAKNPARLTGRILIYLL
jgi:hypothetical protein